MDPQIDDWTNDLLERLSQHGYRQFTAEASDEDAPLGVRRADFRSSWFFTRLHTFILVYRAEVATAADVERMCESSIRLAARNKGGLPLGFQTGIAVLPVLVCRSAQPDAVALAARPPKKRFARMALPVLVDLQQQRVATCSEPLLWGWIYQDFLREQQSLIAGNGSGEVLPPGDEQRSRKLLRTAGVVGLLLGLVCLLLPLIFNLIR